jgi:5-methylcytosine-specific restriction endonuclease McrA
MKHLRQYIRCIIEEAEKKRDYKAEYKKYHSTTKAKKDRVKRNKNRRRFERDGRVSKGDGKEIDHKKPLSKGGGNGDSNLRVVDQKTNRKKGNK